MNIVYIRNYVQKMEIIIERIRHDKRVYDTYSTLKKLASKAEELFNDLPQTKEEYEGIKLDILESAIYLESVLSPYNMIINKRYRTRADINEYTDQVKKIVIKNDRNIDYLCYLNFMYSLVKKAGNLEFELTQEEGEFFTIVKEAVGDGSKEFIATYG